MFAPEGFVLLMHPRASTFAVSMLAHGSRISPAQPSQRAICYGPNLQAISVAVQSTVPKVCFMDACLYRIVRRASAQQMGGGDTTRGEQCEDVRARARARRPRDLKPTVALQKSRFWGRGTQSTHRYGYPPCATRKTKTHALIAGPARHTTVSIVAWHGGRLRVVSYDRGSGMSATPREEIDTTPCTLDTSYRANILGTRVIGRGRRAEEQSQSCGILTPDPRPLYIPRISFAPRQNRESHGLGRAAYACVYLIRCVPGAVTSTIRAEAVGYAEWRRTPHEVIPPG